MPPEPSGPTTEKRLPAALLGPVRGPAVPWWLVIAAIAVLMWVVLDIHLDGPLVQLDHRIAARTGRWDLRDHPAARWPLTAGVLFGQRGVVLVGAALIAAGVTWRAHTCEPMLRLLVAVLSLAVVVYGFKFGLARNAPVQDAQGVAAGHGASFPSGHIANAILLWGLADWSARTWAPPSPLRAAIRVGRWIAPEAVFVSMMLLDYHWLSDFIGGVAVGVILLAFAQWQVWSPTAAWVDSRWPRSLAPSGWPRRG
jgi:membrane-associated phospholipid phosphatase